MEIRIDDGRAISAPSDVDVELAAAIARDHGGFLGIERRADGHVLKVDLPAV